MMKPKSKLLALATAILSPILAFAAVENEVSPQNWKWHDDSGRLPLEGVRARAFVISGEYVMFGSPYAVVEMQNLDNHSRSFAVSVCPSAHYYGQSMANVCRQTTIEPHGSVRLSFPLPPTGEAHLNYTPDLFIRETAVARPRVWDAPLLGARNISANYRHYSSSERGTEILISGSFSREALEKSFQKIIAKEGKEPKHDDFELNAFKLTLPLADWPKDWRAYSTFAAVFLTPAEFESAPEDLKAALEGFRALGGVLVITNPNAAGGVEDPQLALRKRITLSAANRTGTIGEYSSYRRGYNMPKETNDYLGIPLGDIPSVPVDAILLLLAAFSLVAIPILIRISARKNRRLSLFVTLPALALTLTLLVIVAIFCTFGTTPTIRVQSVTFLDQSAKTAATRGSFVIFSPNSVDRDLALDPDVEFRLRLTDRCDASVNVGERLELTDGWVKPLTPSFFDFARYGRNGARLDVTENPDGSVTVANLLGAPIESCVLKANGKIHRFGRIEPGAKADASPTEAGTTLLPFSHDTVFTKATNYGRNWDLLLGQTGNENCLADRTYRAVLAGDPFISPPLGERKVKGSSAAIVIGDFSKEVRK